MIDLPLMIFLIVIGLVCFFIGYVIGRAFRKADEEIKKCETIEDILKREG